jgi:hypothetical protein
MKVLGNKGLGVRQWQIHNYFTVFSSEVSRLVLLSDRRRPHRKLHSPKEEGGRKGAYWLLRRECEAFAGEGVEECRKAGDVEGAEGQEVEGEDQDARRN